MRSSKLKLLISKEILKLITAILCQKASILAKCKFFLMHLTLLKSSMSKLEIKRLILKCVMAALPIY